MKIRIVTPVPGNAQSWSQALRLAEPAFEVVADVTELHAVNVLEGGHRPDLLIAEVPAAVDLSALEGLALAHPELDYLLVASDLAPETLMRAMRAGVREVLPAPAAADAVVEAARRLARKRMPAVAAAAATPPRQGEVIGFVSCKGGSGATFVATNLAQMLSRNGERQVAMLDLNLQFGDAALFLSSEAMASNLAEVARNIHRLDRDLLKSAMTQVSPGLWVLPAPEDPGQASEVTPEHVQAVLALASTMFDFVVVDLGRTLSAVTLRALDTCKRIYVVMQLTLPFVRDGRRLADVFRTLDYNAAKVRWIVNRFEKGGDISLDDVKRTLGVGELITLPNQYEVVASSVNQGIPVERLAPTSAIARGLRVLAETIAPQAPAPRSGWLAGMLHGIGATNTPRSQA